MVLYLQHRHSTHSHCSLLNSGCCELTICSTGQAGTFMWNSLSDFRQFCVFFFSPGLVVKQTWLSWMKTCKGLRVKATVFWKPQRLVIWNWRVRSDFASELDTGSSNLRLVFVCFFLHDIDRELSKSSSLLISCRSLWHASEQRCVKAPRVDTISDYAGCVLTRKSTTCAHLFRGVNLIKAGGVLRRSQRCVNSAGCEKHDD